MENNQHRVSNYFRLPTLKLTALKEASKLADKVYLDKTTNMLVPGYLFGIEVEIERVAVNIEVPLFYWNTTTDGSLRNNGFEFVSNPLRAEQIPGAIDNLNKHLTHKDFSERTSVHVHMNVRDLTIHEIFCLTTIYLVMERILFKWIGHNRDANVFCTPLIDTGYYRSLRELYQNLAQLPRYWNKYTALNLLPMSQKGTIEFRHMYGTLDKDIIVKWVNLLSCLKLATKGININDLVERISNLNSNSNYQDFVEYIFKEYATLFDGYNFQELMEEGVTLVKLGYFNNVPNVAAPRFNVTTNELINTFIRTQDQRRPAERPVPPPPTDTYRGLRVQLEIPENMGANATDTREVQNLDELLERDA